jgi:hypothetical protein
MPVRIIPELHAKYIRGSEKKAIVQFVQAFLCHLTVAVVKGIGCSCNRVHINTRVLKHAYDKRPAQEFDFLIENLHTVVKYPEKVYRNKSGKKGEFCFVKNIGDAPCFCSVQVIEEESMEPICEIVTFFIPGSGYLDSYELLWEWKGGDPSS